MDWRRFICSGLALYVVARANRSVNFIRVVFELQVLVSVTSNDFLSQDLFFKKKNSEEIYQEKTYSES